MAEPTPVVFIHGLWIHSEAWKPWLQLFTDAGYAPIAPGWIGDEATVKGTRANAVSLAGKGIDDITAGYVREIEALPSEPIIIGHSFGGLIAQKLLAQGLAKAAVAIDPAPIRGVKKVPFAQVRSALPVLSKPSNKKLAVSLSRGQFRYGFGNALSKAESNELFERFAIPGPGLPLFEVTSSKKNPNSPAAVDTSKNDRGPLLIIGGEKDHTVPEVVSKAAYELYSGSLSATEYRVFQGRGHSLAFDHGWSEVAEYSLAWAKRHSL